MSEIILPVIPHADVTLNQWGRVVVQMNDGYVFWDRALHTGFTDDEGNPRDPYPEEICYYRYGVFSPATDFSLFVVVPESEVPENQIFGGNTETETM